MVAKGRVVPGPYVTVVGLVKIHYTVGVAKIFRFTFTFFWSIPTYSRTLARSFSEK